MNTLPFKNSKRIPSITSSGNGVLPFNSELRANLVNVENSLDQSADSLLDESRSVVGALPRRRLNTNDFVKPRRDNILYRRRQSAPTVEWQPASVNTINTEVSTPSSGGTVAKLHCRSSYQYSNDGGSMKTEGTAKSGNDAKSDVGNFKALDVYNIQRGLSLSISLVSFMSSRTYHTTLSYCDDGTGSSNRIDELPEEEGSSQKLRANKNSGTTDTCAWFGCIIEYMPSTRKLQVSLIKTGQLLRELIQDGKTKLIAKLKLIPGKKQKRKIKMKGSSTISSVAEFAGYNIEELSRMSIVVKLYHQGGWLKIQRKLCEWTICLQDIDLQNEQIAWNMFMKQ